MLEYELASLRAPKRSIKEAIRGQATSSFVVSRSCQRCDGAWAVVANLSSLKVVADESRRPSIYLR